MFTSRSRSWTVAERVWCAIGVFALVFSRVYLHFSYGVSSPYMVWLAAVPLLGGAVLPWTVEALMGERFARKADSPLFFAAYQALIATASVWFLVAGILDIAEAPSGLTAAFPVLALVCVVVALAAALGPERGQTALQQPQEGR